MTTLPRSPPPTSISSSGPLMTMYLRLLRGIVSSSLLLASIVRARSTGWLKSISSVSAASTSPSRNVRRTSGTVAELHRRDYRLAGPTASLLPSGCRLRPHDETPTPRNPRKCWAVTDPLDHIRKLAEGIGPRAATTKAERDAAEYIEQQLNDFGFSVKIEGFRSVRSFSHTYIAIFVLAIAGFVAAAGFDKGALGLLLTGIAGVAFIGENTTTLHLARTLIPKGKSQNVVGRLAAREMPRRRLVLVAHYDSAKSGLMWHPGLGRAFRRIFVLQAISPFLLPILVGIQGVTRERLFGDVAIPSAAVIVVGLRLLLHRELFYKPVAGAHDNPGGGGGVVRS